MTWADIYLICFLVGFGLSVVALLAGSIHLHLPHLHFHHGVHVPHMHGAHAHADLPWFNFGTIAAFLAWFGGTGYLLARYSEVWFATALLFSIISGLIGGGIVFWFLTRILMSKDESLDPADFESIPTLASNNSPYRDVKKCRLDMKAPR